MPARLLDGKALAKQIQRELKARIQDLQKRGKRSPGLAVLMVGDNPASAAYVRNKERACDRVGIASFGRHFPAETTQEELFRAIRDFNRDDRVDGILVQLPLPPHLDSAALLREIEPAKDADGLHPTNLGFLVRGEAGLQSCTPAGVMRLLAAYNLDPTGKQAVVIGRSILVGKPISLMLSAANATVTGAHSRTQNLAAVARQADILVVAIGRPRFVTAEMVKPGAIVVDVGINRIDDGSPKGRLVGDVDFEAVAAIASHITPVPGGVGPMTVATLLANTLEAYDRRESL